MYQSRSKFNVSLIKKSLFNKIYVGGLLLLPFVLIVLPADFFDKGQSLCLSVLLLHQTCPGCGITRAIQHLIHFDFAAAYQFNKLSFIVFPLLIFGWGEEIIRIYRKIKINQKPV